LPQQGARIIAGTWGTCPMLFVKASSKSFIVTQLLQNLFVYWSRSPIPHYCAKILLWVYAVWVLRDCLAAQ
jgi:hypothetical protein